jgi:hypothetical protein
MLNGVELMTQVSSLLFLMTYESPLHLCSAFYINALSFVLRLGNHNSSASLIVCLVLLCQKKLILMNWAESKIIYVSNKKVLYRHMI